MPQNVEIKARCADPERIEKILRAQNARYIGVDHQIDTYFNVPNGRLKLREGNIENHLIFYQRDNQAGPKKSEVILYSSKPDSTLKSALLASIGEKVIVDKKRAIYFIANVKFHVDNVRGLGSFMEIEAIDRTDTLPLDKLHEQCRTFMDLLQISDADLIDVSYSDMLLAQKEVEQ